MRVLVAHYSETGHTAQIGGALCEGLASKGHTADLVPLGAIAPDALYTYDLVSLGSARHDADLARC